MNDQRVERILIVLLGAIGDVTRALPVVVQLRERWPAAEIVWAVEPASKSIVEHHPAVDRLVVFERKGGFSAYLKFISELRTMNYDLVLDMQRHLKSGATSFLSRGKRRLSFHRKNSREGNWLFNNEQVQASEHFSSKVEQFQNFSRALGIPRPEHLDFGLAPSADETTAFESLLVREAEQQKLSYSSSSKKVALILGSTWPSRFWLAERYQQLIRELEQQLGMLALLVGGPSEKEIADKIMQMPGLTALNLVGKTSLRQLVPLFSSVSFAVGSDSGPMHICAAVGTPVISLWGSTSPLRSAPYGSEDLVLQSAIGCSPCYNKVCPGLGTLCMADIPVQAVLARVEQCLERQSSPVTP